MKVVIMILLFFISVTTAVSSVDGANKINVIDMDGQALTRNGEYNIVPIGGGGGGLSTKTLSYCEFAVIQEEEENSSGVPLAFHPPDDEDVIRLSTDQNIDVGGASICSPTTWRVERSSGYWFIFAGEGIGHDPARNQTDTVNNQVFKIETHQDGYKFSYCPTLCNACNVTSCSDVGIIMEGDGLRRLALTQVPLGVKFKRVN